MNRIPWYFWMRRAGCLLFPNRRAASIFREGHGHMLITLHLTAADARVPSSVKEEGGFEPGRVEPG
ncbi:protein of unknown function [Methylocaldum szegediense]|uniref:Uncharacterized protein n=1 Tax=Methylocaldum szegediense TaxID=73780 RepID=A0ABM9HYP5_9GAMM|nr:protein of unknown function [Methylocaldum szegediense]